MTEIMPVPPNLNFTVLPTGTLWAAFWIYRICYSMDEPPVTIQQAREATVSAPVYTLPVRR